MKIVVNTRLLLENRLEGIGWFSYETLKLITRQHKDVEFYFLFDRDYSEEFIFSDNITPIIIGPPARHPVLFYIWFEHSVKNILKRLNPDLFLSPDGYLSLSAKTKSLAVIHDLNFEHYPEDFPWLIKKYYTYYFPKFAKRAERIATVSEFSKQDIIKQYGILPEKIDVLYNGANKIYAPVSENEKQLTRNQYTDGKPFFIFVSTLLPRKNITNLFKAFDKFKKHHQSEIKLLVVGEKKWWTTEMQNAFKEMDYKDDVVFSGRLSAEKLQLVLGSALALTYVSYFEGFGIPIVEAFKCETPVITSNITSMPEIAGDAALLIDPFSVDSISEAMMLIAKDTATRKKLIARGIERADIFSWQKTADRLWESIDKTTDF